MKKNIIFLVILIIIGSLYFGLNYLNDKSREKNNTSNISISFKDFSYDKIKSDKLEINNSSYIYSGTGVFNQDDEKVEGFINELKDIKILSITSTNKENFDSFGVNNSGAILEIGNIQIFLGNTKGWAGEQYIRIKGMDRVFLINKDLKSFLDKGYNYFKKEENSTGELKIPTLELEKGVGEANSTTGGLELPNGNKGK